jgi:hypothetical protein
MGRRGEGREGEGRSLTLRDHLLPMSPMARRQDHGRIYTGAAASPRQEASQGAGGDWWGRRWSWGGEGEWGRTAPEPKWSLVEGVDEYTLVREECVNFSKLGGGLEGEGGGRREGGGRGLHPRGVKAPP